MAGFTKGGPLPSNEISAFCAELALIIKAGIPVQEGISMMCEDTHNSSGKALLSGILDSVEAGHTLAFALGESALFPKYVVDMVEIGEASGRLDEVMDSLCLYYERSEAISKSIKNAVAYPAVMIAMMMVVIFVLVVKVLPIFQQVFRQLGSELSSFATGIMAFGTLVSRFSVGIIAVLAAVVLSLVVLRATQKGRALLWRWYDSCFLTRRLSSTMASGRFAWAMSLMLSSGLDVEQSLDMAQALIENPGIRDKITQLKALIAQGTSFSQALVDTHIFSSLYARMITVGFKAGSVDVMMKKIAQRYDEELDTRISNILSVLEPTLVAVLSVIVGMILLSVMLPLMGVMSSIG